MNTNQPLISVIIPVYNVASYLPRCLDSVCGQTYPNLEIILVDDGSTDNSLEICQQYANQDKRITVIHQGNGGLSAARNSGMDQMHGDFFTFVDSDDWITPDYCQKLFHAISQTGADVSCGNYMYAFENGSTKNYYPSTQLAPFLKGEDIFLFGLIYHHTAWLKLYRTARCGHLRFDPYYLIYEDLDFFFRLAQHIDTWTYVDETLLFYFQRANSLMRSSRLKDREKILSLLGKMKDFFEQKDFIRARKYILPMYLSYGCFFTLLTILEKPFVPKTELNEAYSWLKNNRQNLFHFKEMGLLGHLFVRAFYYFPRITTGGLRLPGIRGILQKFILKRLIPPL